MPNDQAGTPVLARSVWRQLRPLLGIIALFFLIGLLYNARTAAWSTNDEPDHVQYAEYIVSHGHFPPIATRSGDEAGQPPLFYLTLAGWQDLLRIPVFTPAVSSEAAASLTPGERHQQALWDHELRLLSLVYGALTVAAVYFIGLLALRSEAVATGSALFVTLLPKMDLLSAAVTNDSLVIALCALATLCMMRWVRPSVLPSSSRVWWALAAGILSGAAILTKYDALPVVALLLLVGALSRRSRRALLEVALAVVAAVGVSGWWFIRNEWTYGQLLATSATNQALRKLLPGLILNYPLDDLHRYLVEIPIGVAQTLWYVGGENQLTIPNAWSELLGAVAVLLIVVALLPNVGWFGRAPSLGEGSSAALLVAVLVGGVAAAEIIGQATTQVQGRYLYGGLAGLAILSVAGAARLARLLRLPLTVGVLFWPALLAVLNVYVIARYLVPL
jgi:4-amino-4-deoxy-L-arabinose transferase-like glycosyltransferase